MCSTWKLNNFLPPLVKMCPVSSKENVCTKKYSYQEFTSLPSEYETRTICHIEKWVDLMWNHISFDSLGWCKHIHEVPLWSQSILLCAIMVSSLKKDVMFLNLSEYLPEQSTIWHSVKQSLWKRECESTSNLNASLYLPCFYQLTWQYIILSPSSSHCCIQNSLLQCGNA